ncbi:hypothetical protein RLOatenuis_6500 [Rickettsiales bacterium]|nr:hypothetical protein RLOatenuis_6500 [Rickettsiales bacterium]
MNSSAAFFRLKLKHGVLSDVNNDLISLCNVMKDYPDDLYKITEEHQKKHNKDYYYEIRARKYRNDVNKAV